MKICKLIAGSSLTITIQPFKLTTKMEFEDLKVEVPLDEEIVSDLKDVPVKKYRNKESSNFVVGFDVTSKEAEERRLKRARRFGLQEKEKSASVTEIEALPSCVQNLPVQKEDAKVRPDAILLFGVFEMSTKDVFDYFQEYMPSSIEWIDDVSCVVVWEDENSAKRAFINMGSKFTPAVDDKNCEDEHLENIWRIGMKHPKSKQLLMRYATSADKKMKDAGSRSLYYLVHGRPQQQQKRQANKRGLVSSSRRRKINADQTRIKTELNQGTEVEIVDHDIDENMDGTSEEDMDIDEPPIKVLISEDMLKDETPTSKLYADQEKSRNIRSRLKNPLESVMKARKQRFLPNSAKMDQERSKNNFDRGTNSLDLRQKLRNRKERFDRKTRPSLSIEITED